MFDLRKAASRSPSALAEILATCFFIIKRMFQLLESGSPLKSSVKTLYYICRLWNILLFVIFVRDARLRCRVLSTLHPTTGSVCTQTVIINYLFHFKRITQHPCTTQMILLPMGHSMNLKKSWLIIFDGVVHSANLSYSAKLKVSTHFGVFLLTGCVPDIFKNEISL